MELRPFHLAIPVKDIKEANVFYGEVLGFSKGRSSDIWTDWNFYGHQLVTHENKNMTTKKAINEVDDKAVPIPHFGVVLTLEDWKLLAEKVKQNNIPFIIEPYIRFEGQPGEQATMFFEDPFGNALEFKAFKSLEMLFEK